MLVRSMGGCACLRHVQAISCLLNRLRIDTAIVGAIAMLLIVMIIASQLIICIRRRCVWIVSITHAVVAAVGGRTQLTQQWVRLDWVCMRG